jgi:gentisate 1,2-dioxygenase
MSYNALVAATESLPEAANLAEYCAWLQEAGVDAPWASPGPVIAAKKTKVEPVLWRWREIEPRLERSPRYMVPGEGGERRILRFVNPGVPESTSAHTLSSAIQYLLPGETAPSHRHTPSAVRFMVRGKGAYTMVGGEKCAMSPGDLVLTPYMTYHSHGNEGTEPVMWIDVLDSPIVRYLEALHFESEEGAVPAVATREAHFPWASTYPELERRADRGESDPYDDVILEYLHPESGKSVYPTISCYLQMIRPGVETQAHAQSSTAIYHVVRGSGTTRIAGEAYEWEEGDVFVIPPNAPHNHANAGSAPAVLFSAHDRPLLQALGLYRES